MLWFGKPTIAVAGVAAVAIGVIGCSGNKVAQCNRMIEVANQTANQVRAVTQNTSPQNVEAMTKIADTTDQAAAEMQSVEVTDEQLQTYKDRFITMYANTSKATRELVTAIDAKNGEAAEQSYTALQTATSQEGALVTEVNNYCSGGAAN
jgi:hypothetical protein